MSFRVRVSGADRFELELDGESPSARALVMAPAAIESELLRGRWLVLLFAVWSGPDRGAIEAALDLARGAPDLSVGIRPFDDFAETRAWCPEARPTPASPVWLLLEDGRLCGQREGLLTSTDLAAWVATATTPS